MGRPQLPAHLESLGVFSEEVVRVRPPQRLQLKLQQLAKVASLDGDCSETTVQQPHQPQLQLQLQPQPQLQLQPQLRLQPQPQPRLLQPLQPIVAVSLVEVSLAARLNSNQVMNILQLYLF